MGESGQRHATAERDLLPTVQEEAGWAQGQSERVRKISDSILEPSSPLRVAVLTTLFRPMVSQDKFKQP